VLRPAFVPFIVIPATFSNQLAAVATATQGAPPATLEVLTNPAAGSFAGTYAQSVALQAAAQINSGIADQLTRQHPPSIRSRIRRKTRSSFFDKEPTKLASAPSRSAVRSSWARIRRAVRSASDTSGRYK
jgi:hypothetical protein